MSKPSYTMPVPLTPMSGTPTPPITSSGLVAMTFSRPALPDPIVLPVRGEVTFIKVENIDVLPEDSVLPLPNTTYSIGDTHGNAVALFRYIHAIGLADISSTDYATLLSIYKKKVSDLTKVDLDSFRRILAATFARVTGDVSGIKLRLFGDMLADRGSNDIFTLIVLDEFKKRYPGINVTILLSNHDKAFLRVYLNGSLFDYGITPEELVTDYMVRESASQAISVRNLKILINTSIVSPDEVQIMVNNAYLPFLKLVDYVIRDTTIDVMSHAPLTLLRITSAAVALRIRCSREMISLSLIEASMEALQADLDELNDMFQPSHVAGVWNFAPAIKQLLEQDPNPASNPLWFFTMPRLMDSFRLSSPVGKTSYTLRFRHGHDGLCPAVMNIHGVDYITLDSQFGKPGSSTFFNQMGGASQSPDAGPPPSHSAPPAKRQRLVY